MNFSALIYRLHDLFHILVFTVIIPLFTNIIIYILEVVFILILILFSISVLAYNHVFDLFLFLF